MNDRLRRKQRRQGGNIPLERKGNYAARGGRSNNS